MLFFHQGPDISITGDRGPKGGIWWRLSRVFLFGVCLCYVVLFACLFSVKTMTINSQDIQTGE